jgi:hypothetical protein
MQMVSALLPTPQLAFTPRTKGSGEAAGKVHAAEPVCEKTKKNEENEVRWAFIRMAI